MTNLACADRAAHSGCCDWPQMRDGTFPPTAYALNFLCYPDAGVARELLKEQKAGAF